MKTPTLLYHLGSKYSLAPWILSHIPLPIQQKTSFYEVYGGGGNVLLQKHPSHASEIYNELNPDTYNFFFALKNWPSRLINLVHTPGFEQMKLTEVEVNNPIHKAARFFFHSHTSFRGSGTRWDSQATAYKLGRFYRRQKDQKFMYLHEYANRLQHIHLLNQDAIELIEESDPEALIYADPPYPHEVRNGKDNRHNPQTCKSRNQYAFDYEKADHSNLLSICLKRGGLVLLSSYRNEMYDDYLLHSGWKVSSTLSSDLSSQKREESLYLSPDLWKLLK